MNVTFKQVILLFSGVIVAFILGGMVCPRVKEVEKIVPTIVTQYDTTEVEPEWLQDSLKKWRNKKYTTDTTILTHVQLTITDVKIPIDSPAAARPDIYPVLSINGGRRFGDTTFIRTFSVKDGHMAVSSVFTAGYITDLDVESHNNPTPRINFEPFPPEERHNWLYPIKHTLLGVGIGSAIGLGACIVK
jgi:hypothetical protein